MVLASVAGLLVAVRLLPALVRAVPACMLHKLTGLHCPGCGGTRCVVRLSHGDLAGAMAMNPLVVLYLLGLVAWLAYGARQESAGKPAPALPSWTGWLLGGGVLVFGVLRNLPWWPFTLLAPHA
jgi:hypothetical protein